MVEMTRSTQIQLWSRAVFSASLFVHWQRQSTPRHPPRGCFRYGYGRLDSFVPPISLLSRLLAGSCGAALVWGKEVVLPPARVSSSFLRSPPLAQPPSSFSFASLSCRFRFETARLRRGSALVLSHGRS